MEATWLKPSVTATHHFSPSTRVQVEVALAETPAQVLYRLLTEREQEASWLLAKRIADTALEGVLVPFDAISSDSNTAATMDAIVSRIDVVRAMVIKAGKEHATSSLSSTLQYAYCATLNGSCLRTVSQPASQPAAVVNRLFHQYYQLMGKGRRERSQSSKWQRYLAEQGSPVPDQTQTAQWETAGVSGHTFLIGTILQALGYFGATYLPEIIGFHWAWMALDTSSAFHIQAHDMPDADTYARETATQYLCEWEGDSLQSEAARKRVSRGAALAIALRQLQLKILDQCHVEENSPLEHKVARIFDTHYKFAGPQHGNVKLDGKLLVDIFNAPNFDVLAFVRQFKQSHWTNVKAGRACRFLQAIHFGGPMFGVFNEEETQIISRWLEEPISSTPMVPIVLAQASMATVLTHDIRSIQFCDPAPIKDERDWLYRLINIELFPNILRNSCDFLAENLKNVSNVRWNRKTTRYTDASALKWSPSALRQRVLEIYDNKLQAPCRSVEQMPSKDEVIFRQKTYMLGNLIDGAWLYRLDPLVSNIPGAWDLFAIYADEMGCGKQEENHIALIYQVLESMAISLPHISTLEFCDQDELLDDFYPFAIFQLSLALFPHSAYPAILGYNLAIEMFGLGEMRKQEIEKLRHWNLSTIYEVTHLSIDNISKGHAKQALDAINEYMANANGYTNAAGLDVAFSDIWNGYGSFANFIEGKESVTAEDDEYII
ncbi:hypothetical protein AAKU55_005117 [Oxalobacteraceae bacterium GrIS 1.11]